MLIDSSAIVAILDRTAGSDQLLARLDAAPPPLLVTPLGLFEAVAGLARRKTAVPNATTRAQARDAVSAFVAALGIREIPFSADLGRKAIEIGVETGETASRCFALACARAYRTTVLAVDRD